MQRPICPLYTPVVLYSLDLLSERDVSMYIPKHFEETRIDVLHALIDTYPLATLITHSGRGLNANHIPMHLTQAPKPYGTLSAHVARGNGLLEDLAESSDVLVVFQGPNAYISPSWYATKEETGRVVPTWNYATVHARGRARAIDDPRERLWVTDFVPEDPLEHLRVVDVLEVVVDCPL